MKIGILIRHMKQSRPVTSALINKKDLKLSNDSDETLLKEMNLAAWRAKKEFIKQFPEFEKANWYLDILDTDSLEMFSTSEIKD